MTRCLLLAILIPLGVEVMQTQISGGSQARPAWDRYLTRLPAGLTVKEDGPRNYAVSCDYFILDTRGS